MACTDLFLENEVFIVHKFRQFYYNLFVYINIHNKHEKRYVTASLIIWG